MADPSKSKSKKTKGKKGKEDVSNDHGVLFVTLVSAKNLTATSSRSGTSNPYCVVTATFNSQRFKTKVAKKTVTPSWGQEFKFYVSKPTGHITVKIFDKDLWKEDLLGEVSIPVKDLINGKPVEKGYELENEHKKKQTKTKGEVTLKLHFPVPETEVVAPKAEVSNSSVTPAAVTPEKKAEKKKINDVYNFGEELGRGGFSVVRKGIHKTTNQPFAIKIIEKNQSEDELQLLQREIDIMRKLKHPNIIGLEEVFDEPDYIYLVLELVTGGELFDQIVSRGTYSERDAANVIRQILEAVEFMHENGIAHRDLKPENLLCGGANGDMIKVTDFGLSKDFGNATLRTSCGTPDYVAPEVLKGQPYDNSVDVWSIGVITYILLCGFPPFYGANDQQIFEKILKAEYDFPSPDWDGISQEAKDFIRAILVLDYNQRPTASDCLEAPWIVSATPAGELKRLESFRKGMTTYTEGRKKGKNN